MDLNKIDCFLSMFFQSKYLFTRRSIEVKVGVIIKFDKIIILSLNKNSIIS